jgi:SPP1 gp7 family putative phage head morphogenesis protein
VRSKDRAEGVGALYPFGGRDFVVKGDGTRLYARFEVHTERGIERYEAKDVVYFREFAAVSPLEVLAGRLGIDTELMRGIQSGIRNAVRPGASLRFSPDSPAPTPDQIDELKATFGAMYEGARNQGRLFASGNAELVQHELGFGGLEAGELGKEIEAAICAAFQVPPSIVGAYVGLENSSDRANMETAERYLYDLAVLPRWSWVEKVLTRQLLRPVDADQFRYLRFDRQKVAALQEDQQEKATIAKDASDILTKNERRALLGYPPIDGGDELPVPPPPPSFGLDDEDEDEDEEDEPEDRPKALFDPRQVAWAIYHSTAEAQEMGWTLAMSRHLAEERAAILALFAAAKDDAAPGETKDEDDPYFPAPTDAVRRLMKEAVRIIEGRKDALRGIAEPLTAAVAGQAVRRTASRVGLSFDLLQPGLTKYVGRHSAVFVTQVSETTKEAIRSALSQGLIEGESIPDLAARISDSGAFKRSRAELIARTETTAAANESSVAALLDYQESNPGVRFEVEWLTAGDNRVRDEHAELDGARVEIGQPFANGLYAPGEPNCRCTLLEHMVEG